MLEYTGDERSGIMGSRIYIVFRDKDRVFDRVVKKIHEKYGFDKFVIEEMIKNRIKETALKYLNDVDKDVTVFSNKIYKE